MNSFGILAFIVLKNIYKFKDKLFLKFSYYLDMNFQPSKKGKLQAVISFSIFVLQNYNWFPLISNDTHIFELLRNLKIEPSCLLLKPGRESLIAGSGFTVQKSAAKS